MDNGYISRIAGRIFTAFTCRRQIIVGGFNYDHADNGIAVFDYRYYLLFWCYPKNGKVNFVFTRKADDAFYRLSWDTAGFGEIGNMIAKRFRERPGGRTVRNFKVLIWNDIFNNKMGNFKNATFLIGKKEQKEYDVAREYLTTNWNISLKEFYSVFGGESSEEMKFSCDGMNFEVNDSSLDRGEIESKMNDVKSKLPSKLAGQLLYGNVELKKKFHDNTIADYNPNDDAIRIDESDAFVTSMIHELGHRWHFKFCKKEQEKKLMRLYKRCKKGDDNIKLNVGDVIECANLNPSKWEIVEVNQLFVKARPAGTTNEPKWYRVSGFMKRGIVSVNGNPTEQYTLPRYYAGKNFKEFVACCFEHAYGGREIGESLKRDFMSIVEE